MAPLTAGSPSSLVTYRNCPARAFEADVNASVGDTRPALRNAPGLLLNAPSTLRAAFSRVLLLNTAQEQPEQWVCVSCASRQSPEEAWLFGIQVRGV